VVSQYCNGSRVPPEYKSMGYQCLRVFRMPPCPTRSQPDTGGNGDEGNNWINIIGVRWPKTNPVTNSTLGNYAPARVRLSSITSGQCDPQLQRSAEY